MKKRWLLSAGLPVLLFTPLLLLMVLPGSWLVPPLERAAGALLGRDVDIGGLELELLSRTPAVSLDDVSIEDDSGKLIIRVGRADVALDAGELFSGNVVFDRIIIDKTTLQLQTDAQGKNNWEDLVPAKEGAESRPKDAPASLPAIAEIELSDIRIDYQNAQSGMSADFLLDASGSTLADDIDTEVRAIGTLKDQAVQLKLLTDPLPALASGEAAVSVNVRLSVGDTQFTAAGRIGNETGFRDPDLMVSLEAPALDDLAQLFGVPLPVIPPYRIAGSLKRDGDDIVLQHFDGEFGDSDIEGDIRLDMTTTPVTLYANVISRVLDLDDLAGIVGARVDDDETTIVDERAPTSRTPGKLLPDKPLDLKVLADSFNGAIQYQALTVQSPVWPVDAIDVRMEVQSDRLVLSPVSVGLAGGRVDGSLGFKLDQAVPAATVEAQINKVGLRQIMAATGIDDDSFGNLGGRLKFWMQGRSVSELAASADGGIFLLMTGGRLDALLTELAGVDLVESITLLLDPEKTRSDIRCAYLDLHADNGKAEFSQFLIDTDDTLFLADGSLDFNDESLNLVMEPQPKDISLIAAQAAINIQGTFARPTVRPGKALAARAVVAAILASVASPVAALLPFVQPASGQDSPFCDGLVETIDVER